MRSRWTQQGSAPRRGVGADASASAHRVVDAWKSSTVTEHTVSRRRLLGGTVTVGGSVEPRGTATGPACGVATVSPNSRPARATAYDVARSTMRPFIVRQATHRKRTAAADQQLTSTVSTGDEPTTHTSHLWGHRTRHSDDIVQRTSTNPWPYGAPGIRIVPTHAVRIVHATCHTLTRTRNHGIIHSRDAPFAVYFRDAEPSGREGHPTGALRLHPRPGSMAWFVTRA